MATILTDEEIAALLSDGKPVTGRQREILSCPNARKNRSSDDLSARIRIKSEGGNRFVIRVRQSKSIPTSFSVILTYHRSGMRPLRMVRCNGFHGKHVNILEQKAGIGIAVIPANTFHIHKITERYQRYGRPDHYAEPTDLYESCPSAIEVMCFQFGCYDPDNDYEQRYPLLNE